MSYYVDGEIYLNVLGTPEGKPITMGHADFKPLRSKTGDMLCFFRRVKNDPDVGKWKTANSVVNADGNGFHQLTDGTHTEFNQTWTRDGKNTPVWNRENLKTGAYCVMASKLGSNPREEIALTGANDDGSVSPDSVALLKQLNAAVRGGPSGDVDRQKRDN